MITDRELSFSTAQAVTVTANSTDVVDLGVAHDIARGQNLRVRVQVDTTFTAGGAATLTIALVTSAAAALSSPTTVYTTAAIPVASLVAGYVAIDTVIGTTSGRYLGIIYTVATGPMTAGAISASVVLDTESTQAARIVGNTGL